MPEEKLGIIVPTKDRPEELKRLLQSISEQDVRPAQIILVDGGDISSESVSKDFNGLGIIHIYKRPPSLTAQRNAGVKALREDITVVAFFDDDIVVENGGLSNMMKFWESAGPDIGGASFNLVNEIYKKPTFIEKIFMVNAEEPNRILRSGFQGKIACVKHTIPAQWLVGCAMVFRKKILEEFEFDEHFSGYARYEDVDFTYTVGKKYRMFVLADAGVKHLNKPEDVNFSFSLGRMEVLNRLYFVRKNAELSILLCYWALSSILIWNALRGISNLDRRYLNRARGNIAGLCHSLLLNHSIIKR